MKRTIIDNGKSNYHIITNSAADASKTYAASVLAQYLYKATKAFVPFSTVTPPGPKRSAEIYIGNNIRDVNVDTSDLSDEGFIIRTIGEDIIITGKTPRGTVYGVYFFLEKFINFRCFTKDVEAFDYIDKLVIDDLDISENPVFEYREPFFRAAFNAEYCVKNRLNSNTAFIPKEMGGKFKFYNFAHSFHALVPVEKYFDKHPEYFSLVNGERQKDPTQLCLSNEDVFQIARKTLRRWIEENPECKIFSVAQNDNYIYCTCPECKETDERYGSPSGSIITFVNRLADDIREDYPDVLIHTFAYQYSKKAPVGLKVADNVVVRLCNIECSWDKPFETYAEKLPESENAKFVQNIHEWGKICKHLYVWDYACNFSNYLLPFPNYKTMPQNLRTYQKNNVFGIIQQGNFAYGETSSFMDLEAYLCAKLFWNPMQDEDKLIDDFIRNVYGKSAYPYIREYISMLCSSVEKHTLSIFQNSDAPYISDELVEKAEQLFASALALADDEKCRWYIRKEYISVLFMKASRMPLENPEREKLIDELYDLVKEFNITEIRERKHLDISFENLRKYRYYSNQNENEYQVNFI